MMKDPMMCAGNDRCDQLGTLAAEVDQPTLPDERQWMTIDRALSPRPRWRHQLRLALPVAVVCAAGVFIGSRLTLAYRAESCATTTQGLYSTPANHPGSLSFEDGSRFELGPASTAELRAVGFRRGANLHIHKGRTSVSIIKRFAGRWHVLAGPFDVRVTGTAFSVDWDPVSTRFRVQVTQGTVRVSGGPLNGDTPVIAGQSLDILASSREIAWNSTEPAPALILKPSSPIAPPAPSAAGLDNRATKKRRLAANRISAPKHLDAPVPLDPWIGPAPLGQPGYPMGANADLEEISHPRNNPAGALFVAVGDRTKFLAPADTQPSHLFKERNRLCTNVRIPGLACAPPDQDCDVSTNWGVLLGWYPRSDHKPWGRDRAKRISIDFQGPPGLYRLVAHLRGYPMSKAFCVDAYVSGRMVEPTDFRSECWGSGGRPLLDFTTVDFIALQRPATSPSQSGQICIGAVNLE